MKRLGILVYIFIMMGLGLRCNAQSQYSASLTRMEKSLFGIDYSTQDDNARLKRIEEVVYGAPSSTAIPQRVDKLSKDLSAELMGQEIKPKKDTFAEDETAYKEDIPKADASVNYPVVDGLERQVFNKDFKGTEINQRLSNLEKNVFKKTFGDDLNTRVDRLKLAIAPQRTILEKETKSDDGDDSDYNYYGPQDSTDSYSQDDILSKNASGQDWLSQNPRNSFVPNYNTQKSVLDAYSGTSDVRVPLSALEKSVLKKSFPDDTVPNRLTRLEVKVFSSNFSDDDEQTRLDRLSSAHRAQKTSKKYDSNKFAQHSATAMQFGAILLMILAAII